LSVTLNVLQNVEVHTKIPTSWWTTSNN